MWHRVTEGASCGEENSFRLIGLELMAGYSQKRSWRQAEVIVLTEKDRSGLEREIYDSFIYD